MLRSILQNSTAGFYIFASDSTTPTSGKTGLTITTTLSKVGGTANSVSPTITEIGNGLYWVAPIAAHRDTLGEIAWQFSATGAIIAPRLEKVVAVNDQTARFGASDGTGVTLAASQPNYAPLTTLGTNAPAGWLNAAAFESGSLNGKGDWSTANLFSGITYMKNWLAVIMGKAADTTTRAEVNATTAGATFNETTDSLEAIRDRGDAAGDWTADEKTAIKAILGIPSSGTTPADPTTGILDTIRDQVVANGTALAGTPIQPTSRVASGGTITAYIGDDFKVRSDTELSLSVSDVGGTLYTKWSAIGEENLYFGASREGADVGAITGTVASITSVGSGASQTCKLTVEITNCGSGLKPGTYDYQIEQRQTQGSDTDSFIEVAGSLILKRNSVA